MQHMAVMCFQVIRAAVNVSRALGSTYNLHHAQQAPCCIQKSATGHASLGLLYGLFSTEFITDIAVTYNNELL